MEADKGILEQIDKIQLSERLRSEREEFFKRDMEVTPERAVLSMESWQESGDDVLDVRWAKLYQIWAERLPIAIFKDQLVLGSETKLFRGADPWVEYDAPNMFATIESGQQMRQSAARVIKCNSDEDWEALGEAFRFFLGRTPIDATYKIYREVYGDWPDDFEKARGFRRPGNVNMTAPVPDWDKLLHEGLRSIIQEAEAGLEKV
ncbi:pyruvate formate lyase family protein, partial [Chloroflexota bacterium]